MRRLYEARDSLEAQLLADHLTSYHIDAVVLGEQLQGAAGELAALNFPTVWVVENEDFPRAKQLLKLFLESIQTPAEGPEWQCERCGETIDAELQLCWNCGTPRP